METLSKPEVSRKEVVHKAISYLARREHSRDELRQKLLDKSFPIGLVEEVMEWLMEQDLQSDLRFAESYANHRKNQGHGPLRIQMELSQKGVSDSLIRAAMDELEVDWWAQVEKIHRKRFGDEQASDVKEKNKRWRFLQYRGFTSDQIKSVVK